MLLPKRSFSDNYFGIGWCKKVLFFLSCCCCLLHDLPTYNVCICNISIRVIHFHARRRSIYHLLVINSKKWQRKLWTCSKEYFVCLWTMLFSSIWSCLHRARFVTRFVSLYHFLSFESHIIKGDISEVKRMRLSVICICFIISIKKVRKKDTWRMTVRYGVVFVFNCVCASFHYSLDTS